MDEAELPTGWEVWTAEPEGRIILVFRPDVFDGGRYPQECLPTIFVGPRRDPRGGPRRRPSGTWSVELRLEPAVTVTEEIVGDRPAAAERATELAVRFSEGAIDYHDAYQLPREGYLAKLDTLVGANENDEEPTSEREA